MHVVLGVIPNGKGRKGLGPAGVAIVPARSSTREKGPRDPGPQPRSNRWRAAGALFSCSLHLRYLIRGSTHPPPTWLQAHLRLRSAGPAGLQAFSHLHFSLSADWPVKRRSQPASHTVAAQSRRHWLQRLSVKLVARVLAPGVTLFLMDWLHAGPPIPSSTTTHIYTHTDTHTQRKAIIECRRMLGA